MTHVGEGSAARPRLDGVHHLKYPVSDLDRSLRWWEALFGAERRPEWDHHLPDGRLFAYMLLIPGIPCPLELRLAPGSAAAMSGFDAITFAVDTLSGLEAWSEHFDDLGLEHSGVLRGFIGWVLVVNDPDGLPIRLYTNQTHEWDAEHAQIDTSWTRPLGRDLPGA